MYDFDKIIDRKGTDSLKFDCAKLRGKKGDELSLGCGYGVSCGTAYDRRFAKKS